MNNSLSEAIRPARFNTNRIEISKEQKGTGKTANDTSLQLINSGFDSSQIGSVLDKVSSDLLQRPWEDTDGWKPSFESHIKPSFGSLLDIIKPAIEKPVKPLPGFPLPGKPVGPQLFPQPEVELADPGLTDTHQTHNDKDLLNVADDITFEDIDGDIEVNGITLTDVDQGYVADCYLMAALGSVALHNPDYIRNMITDNGNGTYTVSFGGELGDVTVDDDFAINQDDKVVYAQTIGDGTTPELWVAIIEKAFAQADPAGSYEGIEYGRANEAIAQITGQTNFTVAQPSAFTPERLATALANGQSVTASTPKDPDGEKGKKEVTPDGLVFNHAYVVKSVRQNETTGEWEVEVYDPRKTDEFSGDGKNDGFTVLTMEQFNTNFREVQVLNEPVG